ncbi:putative hydroxybutyrate dehydrogenase [Sclerotinia borealis F-4128]|uniref:Putative hydroxybutyrate dehydrogenase n=1 Tax=Sclerotinia borealis (strain F-4128) TaxID=1432307 RepID=W9CHT0_SCLBF|nr:putative hydroxybutyrate dehydrogenase [Sclerotinia borealis F-4128]
MAPLGSVLITGCSDGGSGSALASVFQQHGYLVFATAPDTKKMSRLETFDNVKLLALDVRSSEQIRAAVELVGKETGGSLNYLINCAARNRYMPILDEDIEEAKKLYDINVWGPLAVTKAFSPLIIKAKGTLVFITSVAGCLNTPYQGVYAAAKRSEEIIADTLRLELTPFNVKVLCVVTGAVDTNIQTHFKDLKLPADSLYTPIESTICDRAKGNDGAKRIDPTDYAKRVAADILKGKTGKIWHGWSAGTVKFTTSFLPTSLMDKGVVIGTGLDVLAKHVE